MPDHLYLQVAAELRAQIEAGEYAPGQRLPSAPELARERGISDRTARQALGVLVSEGIAEARAGSGTYVRERRVQRPLTRSFKARLETPPGAGSPYQADTERQGHRAAWSYESRTAIALPDIRDRLKLGEPGDAEDVVRTDYVFTRDGEPAELSTSWEPLAVTRGTPVVLPEDGPQVGVMDRMFSIGVIIDNCVERVRARIGTMRECATLKVPPGSIMFAIVRTYYAGGRPVETADIVMSAERYELEYGDRVRMQGE